jgi:hypothetical protein
MIVLEELFPLTIGSHPAGGQGHSKVLDLSDTKNVLVYDVSRWDEISVQGAVDLTWTTAAINVKQSNDGKRADDFATSVQIAAGGGMKSGIAVKTVKYVIISPNAAEASATARITVMGAYDTMR